MEQTLGSDITPGGWINRPDVQAELQDPDPVHNKNGLNGIHVDSLRKLLNKLDRCVENSGTHLVDEAKFILYDGEGDGITVLLGFDERDSMHYLIGVEG